jgi:acyl-CoA thioester hydrolase
MARIKIDLPEHFSFTTSIAVRITDLNYGGHVGNDTILSLIHEARVQFLRHHGYTELDLGGVSLIMGDVAIEFKSEIFYGDELRASVAAGEFSRAGFDLFYKLESSPAKPASLPAEKWVPAAFAKTGMVCFNYTQKKVVALPEEVLVKLKG